MKKNVFISSTFIDLKDHREEVWKLLENYNVNILGMEKFGARKETPLQTCLNEVDRTDIYIGIIATRFGSLEPESNKSYTQLEYEKALELKKDILIYLVDDEAEIKVKAIDYENREQLENFKKLLKEKHTVDFFTEPKDLSNRLKNRLDEILTTKKLDKYSKTEDESIKLLEKFLLFPNKYQNYEITIKIKMQKKAVPLSKEACIKLGFEFGETIVTKFEIADSSDKNQIKRLIIPEEKSDVYFNLEDNQEIKILARLIFSDDRINNIKALLIDDNYSVRKQNPDYTESSIQKYMKRHDSFGFNNEPEYIYERGVNESDCSIFLEFIKQFDEKPNKTE